jgi:branched-chain amino acid transport system ATP-binding protein
VLTLDHVVRTFGSLRAVDDVSLTVDAGTVTGLIGPNGAGKTTLFNTIAGAVAPQSGSILLNGARIEGLRPDEIFHLGLGRTFQTPRSLTTLSLLENMLLPCAEQSGERFWNNWLQRGKVEAEEKRNAEKARSLIDFVGLGKLIDQPAAVLSGGQHKLLELARILMVDPDIVLLDEPAAGVNPVLLETLVERIMELNRGGLTFLLIEHNMDIVMQMCDPLIVMAQGKVVVEGSPEAVRNDPRVIDAYLGDQP